MASHVLPNTEVFSTTNRRAITLGEARVESQRGPVRKCDLRELLLLCADVVESEAFPEPLPRTLRRKIVDDPLALAAEVMPWRKFETKVIIKGIHRPWDLKLAKAFNKFISRLHGHPAKPIVCDFPRLVRTRGMHCRDRIRLCDDLPDAEKYRLLLHEIAHYRVCYHRRRFVRELATVYGLWLKFVASRPPT